MIIAVFIASIVAFLSCVFALSKSGRETLNNGIKIVLDAGHGGIDDGAVGTKLGLLESEVNLSIVNFLKEYLQDAGFSVHLTRSSSAGLYGIATSTLKKKDMEKRKEIIEKVKPEIVISVHLNKYSLPSRAGAQVFYKANSVSSEKLAMSIQSRFNEMEESLKNYSALKGDYFILNCTEYTSVLCECGFLSNEREERLLSTEEYQRKIAYEIYSGVTGYLYESAVKYF